MSSNISKLKLKKTQSYVKTNKQTTTYVRNLKNYKYTSTYADIIIIKRTYTYPRAHTPFTFDYSLKA